MRKDVKIVVALACLLLVGLLGYVLFAPSHKKGAVAEEGTEATGTTTISTNTGNMAPPVTTPAPEATNPPVTVAVAPPTTQPTPAVTVTLGTEPTTQSITPAGPSTPVLPSTDSNVALAGGPTDWAKTLNTGSVASSGHSAPGSNTLMGTTDSSTPTVGGSTGLLSGATSSTRSSVTGGKTHKVVFGETLSSIAADYYGTKAAYTKIQAANPTVNANHLKVGTILNIPDLKASKSDEVGTAGSTEKAVASSGSTYAVKSGDSLQKIATKLYGSADKWQKIYDLNRSAIGGDPHRLRAGMTLKLPEPPTTAVAR